MRREGRPLALLLDGVDEAVFNNVFAFGLGEIQELATLTDSAAADLLYELTLGLDRVSLIGRGARARNLAPAAACRGEWRPGQIAELVERRDRLRAEIRRTGRGHAPLIWNWSHERQELDRAAARARGRRKLALDAAGKRLALAQQLEPRWRSRQDLDRRLAALGTVPHVADDCLPTLEDLKARLATRRNRLQRVTERRKELIAEMGRLKINDALCRQAPRLEALPSSNSGSPRSTPRPDSSRPSWPK